MTDAKTPTSLDGVTALYRRFRPGRFAELRGQDHVVRALQGATRNGRIVHAYLFSGPRGTGKTTTARILAKALNCEHPLDGDACNECASCVAITKGSSLDVVELDAASNNGVDDVREITAGAWHGTPGRWKVYIVDEVHQLSKSASAALLKTIEEPPSHVVFVLATTDPHKVLPTIRSRTQHLEFRLIAGDTLSTLLHDVQGAAGLDVDEGTIEAAVRLGRGSARDALSALDQLIATGSLVDTQPRFDDLLDALERGDTAAAIRSLALLLREGWDPEQLAESFVSDVRQVFLLQVAPDVADAVDTDRQRLADWGTRLGLARTVRILETVGRAMREMKSAPDKVVVLEVALARLARPDLDHSIEALDERLTRLERGVNRAATPPPSPAPALPPIGAAATVKRESTPRIPTPTPAPPTPTAAPSPAPSPAMTAPPAPDSRVAPDEDPESLRDRFLTKVVPRTSRAAQLLLRSAHVRSFDGTQLVLVVATEELRQNTDRIQQGLRGALEHEFHAPVDVVWEVDATLPTSPAPSPTRSSTRTPAPVDEDVIVNDDDPVVVVDSVADHLITEMFPGAEEIS